ncbi:MAG TPA: DoxX family protein [Aliidongia sp.]|uniref:DoxX family protein n=1 Tax=Aliidongia sp. TaxID=1914230 RepID=UPI002DDCFB71|nr:DoxX family protein [Aliidongia sp.]HEV2673102.1 DoxX family protein [Aliidongia sp.]
MTSDTQSITPSKISRWAGRTLTGLVMLFMAFDCIGKLIQLEPVVQSLAALGLPNGIAHGLGAIEVIAAFLCAVPKPRSWTRPC